MTGMTDTLLLLLLLLLIINTIYIAYQLSNIQRSQKFVPILSRINPVHAFPTDLFKTHFSIIPPSTPRCCQLYLSFRFPGRTQQHLMCRPHAICLACKTKEAETVFINHNLCPSERSVLLAVWNAALLSTERSAKQWPLWWRRERKTEPLKF